MDELVLKLSEKWHDIRVGGPRPSAAELRSRIDELGYILIRFTGTRGATDVGVPVDTTATVRAAANFDLAVGTVHVEGDLVLNEVPVRCVVDIDLPTLDGRGRLVPR